VTECGLMCESPLYEQRPKDAQRKNEHSSSDRKYDVGAHWFSNGPYSGSVLSQIAKKPATHNPAEGDKP